MEDRTVVAVGLGLCLAGVALVVFPQLAVTGLPTLLALFFAVAVVAVAVVVALSYLANPDRSPVRLPTPEQRPRYRQPGDSFAALLEEVGLVGHRAIAEREETADDDNGQRTALVTLRERLTAELESLAEAVLARTAGCRPAEARERLAAGEWTDDAEAAAFFTDGLSPPLSVRHRLPVGRPTLPVVERARHAVVALSTRIGGPTPNPDRPTQQREPEDTYWPTDDLPVERSTGRTRQAVVALLLASGLGVFAGSPGIVLVATLGVALAATARYTSPSVSVTLARTVEETDPDPGEAVTVTVTVENDGDRTLPDLRLLDGVPAGLTVVEDSPRFTTALRPGRGVTFSYTVEAVEGVHTFEPAITIAGDFVGATERVETVAAVDGPTELDCGFEADAGDVPVGEQVTPHAGLVEGEASGAGVEFDTVREYQPGDPPARIDWHHRAKTGDLSTVDFREPRRPRVVLVVDARPAAYVASDPHGVPAPRHCARAALSVGVSLLSSVQPVGLATVGHDCWVPPRGGSEQRARLRRRLAGAETVPWTPPASSPAPADAATALTARLDADAQVVFFSPLADDDSVALCRRLRAAGHAVSVVSPDCTGGDTARGTAAAAYGYLTRWRRCSTLRGDDVTVQDWDPTERLLEVSARVE